MNLYLVLVTERVSLLGDSSSILKSFTFMDEEIANRFINKIKKIQEKIQEKSLISGTDKQTILDTIQKKYSKIPLNFDFISNVELKTLGKINVNLDFLECNAEPVI